MVCAGKEGTRKIIAGIDGHTVHGQTLRARRLMEIVPGHGEIILFSLFFCRLFFFRPRMFSSGATHNGGEKSVANYDIFYSRRSLVLEELRSVLSGAAAEPRRELGRKGNVLYFRGEKQKLYFHVVCCPLSNRLKVDER